MQQEGDNHEEDEDVDDMYADLDSSILLQRMQQQQQQRKRMKSDDDAVGVGTMSNESHPTTLHVKSATQDRLYIPSTTAIKSDLFTSLQQDIEILQKKLNEYQTENETLKRNMGTLYRTAKAELERKNRRIEELEQLLQRQQQTKST